MITTFQGENSYYLVCALYSFDMLNKYKVMHWICVSFLLLFYLSIFFIVFYNLFFLILLILLLLSLYY